MPGHEGFMFGRVSRRHAVETTSTVPYETKR